MNFEMIAGRIPMDSAFFRTIFPIASPTLHPGGTCRSHPNKNQYRNFMQEKEIRNDMLAARNH